MKEDFVMPSYFEMLSMADFDAAGVTFVDSIKSMGVIGALAILVVLVAWLFLVLGLVLRTRGLLGVAVLSALGAMLLGWGGSYLGYSSAANIVAIAKTAPKEIALVGGANQIFAAGVAPTVAACLPLLLAAILMPFIDRKSE